jgi:RimJ/RimL family protein N-acetyltransferase
MLRGDLVDLRPIDRAHIDAYLRWMNDTEVTRHLEMGRHPLTREMEEDWFDRVARSDDTLLFGIHVRAEDGRLIGNCSLSKPHPRHRSSGFGIVIGEKDAWGRGYGTDALRTLCRFGFEELNCHRIELWVFDDNERGIRAYAKAGFVEEGRRRESVFAAGRYGDAILMSILEDEWRKLDGGTT